MKTIVSVTPLPVNADSRTLKIAASFSRFGYESVVVEGGYSTFGRDILPFRLVSLGRHHEESGESNSDNVSSTSRRLTLGTAWRTAFEITWLPAILLFLPWIGWYLREYMVKALPLIPPASLYYMHSYLYFPAVYLAARRHGAGIIYDAHDFYSGIRDNDKSKFGSYMEFVFRTVEKLSISTSKATVTVCDGVAQLIEKRYGTRPFVIRNNHDPRLDRTLSKTIRDLLDLSSDIFLSLTIGTSKKGQSIDAVIASAKKLPEHVHFAFLGKGYKVHSDKVEAEGVANRFHFLGPVFPYDLVPFAASADVALILYYPRSPNYQFALPNGFFQGIAAGLPTLYPDLPEIRRLAERFNLGLMIDPTDPDSIAKAILLILREKGLRERMSKQAKNGALELSWEREEVALQRLIEVVIG